MNNLDIENSSHVDIFKDGFMNNPDLSFWTLKRSENNRVFPVKWLDKNALQVVVKPGDRLERGNDGEQTERSEISEGYKHLVREGKEAYYGFSFAFPGDFPINDNRLVFAQWKQVTEKARSPFISWRFRNGEITFLVIDGEERLKFNAPKKEWRADWHRSEVYYKIEKGKGFAIARIDGEEVCNYEGKLGIPESQGITYFKMGLYRDAFDCSQTIYLSDFERRIK